eukprot:3151384-Pyramimonas_sp.AAC.1
MSAPCPPQPCLPDVGAFECQVPSGNVGTRPALQREHDFEWPKRGNEGGAAAGAPFWKNQKRRD